MPSRFVAYSGRLPGGLDDSIVDLEPPANAPARALASPIDLSDAHASGARMACKGLGLGPVRDALRQPYRPVACGPWETRRAIAGWHSAQGRPTAAQDVVLTASTSEALSYVFKWRCKPGDAVAHMQPGYPLLAHLAQAEGLVPVPVASHFRHGRWQLDLQALTAIVEAGCRCVVLTSPNNPTGATLSAQEQAAVAALCTRSGAICVVDEVFAPYRLHAGGLGPAALPGAHAVVCLGGMSKAALLPQLKVSWLCLEGNEAFRREGRIAMTWLADLYLSVSTPSAALAARIVAELPALHDAMRTRLSDNAHWLAHALQERDVGTLCVPDGGFVAPLQFSAPVCRAFAIAPGGHGGEALQRRANVSWQSAALYDLPPQWHAVISLLLPPRPFRAAWRRLIHAAAPASAPSRSRDSKRLH